MSLNYGTLKTQVLADAHRTGLGDAKAADFVRQAEGVIARRLRASEMMTRSTFEEADRVTVDGPIYKLPADFLEVGVVYTTDGIPMDKVGLGGIHRYAASLSPRFYATLSKFEIEFRGTPGTDASLDFIYFARPETFTDNADVNAILTDHETIYLHAALSALYTFTQDLELAQVAAGIAEAAIETLNEQAGRLLAGARSDGFYCLQRTGSY